MEARWEHFEHKGDIGIRGYGKTPEEAFKMAALAMTAVITDPTWITPEKTVTISSSAEDLEILFLEFLNTILFEMDTQKTLFGKFDVKIEGTNLKATCYGEKINTKKHQPAVEVKAATLCELKVEQQPDSSWIAQCVLDV
ncbi:MAG: archease [Verrucomicrobiae bacterium]|nr:archease [Verrucomicrobiae bacterium]